MYPPIFLIFVASELLSAKTVFSKKKKKVQKQKILNHII